MTNELKPLGFENLSFVDTKAKKPKKAPKQPATEQDFGDWVVEKGKWFAKEALLDPLMWIGNMLATPQYAITNLIAAPNDKKLSYFGQNMRHLMTAGLWEASDEAMAPPSRYMFGEQTAPFWSLDTAKRLAVDIISDPLTYASGIGAVSKAGKYGGNVMKAAQKMRMVAQETKNPAFMALSDARSLFKAIAKGDDVVSIAKNYGDDFAVEMKALVEQAGDLRLKSSLDEYTKLFKSQDKALEHMFDWYNKSVDLGRVAESMGDNGADFLKYISKNSDVFATRQFFKYGVGKYSKTFNLAVGGNAELLATKLSQTMPARMISGVASKLSEWRGKSTRYVTDALHDFFVGTGVGFNAAVIPELRIIDRLKMKHSIDEKMGAALESVFERKGSTNVTDDILKAEAKRLQVSPEKFTAAYKEIAPHFQAVTNEAKAWFEKNGGVELAAKKIQNATDNSKFFNKVIDEQSNRIKAMRESFSGEMTRVIPKPIMDTLNKVGIKDGFHLAAMSDDNILDLVNSLKLTDESGRASLVTSFTKLRDESRSLFDVAGEWGPKKMNYAGKSLTKEQTLKIKQLASEAGRKNDEIYEALENLSKLKEGAARSIDAQEVTNALRVGMGYIPHGIDPKTIKDFGFIKNLSKSMEANDFFQVPNEPHVFMLSNQTRMFRAVNEQAYEEIKRSFGANWNDEIERAVHDAVSIPLTSEEVNILAKTKDITWGKYIEDLKQVDPQRAEWLSKMNPDPKGSITTTIADLFEARDATGIKKFFTEDPFFAFESWARRESYAYSTEEATKAAIYHYAKFQNELPPGQKIDVDYKPIGELYTEKIAVLPPELRVQYDEMSQITKTLNTNLGHGKTMQEALDALSPEVRVKYNDYLNRGLLALNAQEALIAGDIVIPTEMFDYISRLNKSMHPKEAGQLLRGIKETYNVLNRFWVMTTLTRPAYHMRNLISSMGMNLQYGVLPHEHLSTIHELFLAGTEGVERAGQLSKEMLSMTAKQKWEKLGAIKLKTMYGEKSMQWMFEQYAKKLGFTTQIQSLMGANGKLSPKQAIRAMQKGVVTVKRGQFWAGSATENTVRVTAFKHFLKQGKSLDEAADMVKKIHYDYGDLSYVDERIKNIMPFWAWTRKSIPGQLRVMNNSGIIRGIELKGVKARKDTQLPEELTPEYLTDGLGIETHRDAEGNPHFLLLGSLFPLAEINKLAMHPKKFIQNFGQSLSPLLKEPLQQIVNYDFFTEDKIKKWEGQTGEYLGMQVPIKLRHAAMNIVWLNEISRIAWKDKPGYPAPSWAEKASKFFVGINLKPVSVKKQLAKLEYQYRTQVGDLVANYKRTIRYGDSHNASIILNTLQGSGYDVEKMLSNHLKDISKDPFQVRATRTAIEKAQLK